MSEAPDGGCAMDWSSLWAECESGGCPGHILPNDRVVSHEGFVEFCLEYQTLTECPGGRRRCVSESGEILDNGAESESGSSTDTSEGSQDDGWDEIDTGPRYSDPMPSFFGWKTERTSSGPRAHRFEYSKNHTCCSDSVFESDDSDWDMSRDHSMEAEMVFAYNLPNVPRTVGEIPEVPPVPFTPTEHVGGLPEIDDNSFARAVRANRKGFEQERRRWDLKTRPAARRRVHVAYMHGRERKRNAKEAKKMVQVVYRIVDITAESTRVVSKQCKIQVVDTQERIPKRKKQSHSYRQDSHNLAPPIPQYERGPYRKWLSG